METRGSISADGSVQYYGYERMDAKVVSVLNGYITIRFAGGRYWDNGGEHYVPAYVETNPLEELYPGNEPGAWQFCLGRGYRVASYHPQMSQAVPEAMRTMQSNYERFQRTKES